MIHNQKVLGIIPARGGSKGVKNKNIRILGGKPLIAWTIEATKSSKYLDRCILSSESENIINIAKSYHCEVPFQRDARLARDETPSIDVVIDAMERCPGYDWVVVLQPTSPLRIGQDIDRALEKCTDLKAPACVSVCEAEQTPYWMYTIKDGEKLEPILPQTKGTRRQDLPKVYILNGAIYLAEQNWLRQVKDFKRAETVAYQMPTKRSLDIDTELDFELAEALIQRNNT